MELRKTWPTTVSLALAVLVVIGGGLSLYGWATSNSALTDWTGRGITIKPNTAVCLVLMGSALAVNQLWPKGRWLVRVLAGIAALIGGLTVFEHVSGINLGIDTLLFDEPPGSPATTAPGRMGPPASNSFVLLGTAVVLLKGGAKTRVWSIRLSLVVTTIALMSVAGYLYGAVAMFSISNVTAIAMQTAVMLVALGLAIVLAVPERDPVRTLLEDSVTGVVGRRLLPFLLIVPLLLGKLRLLGVQHHLFDSAFGTAIRSVVEVVLFSILAWYCFRSIRDHESARHLAEAALAEEQAKTRQAVMQNEARLSALLSQLPVGVGLTDKEGKCIAQSAMFKKFVGSSIPSQDPSQFPRWRGWDAQGQSIPPDQWPGARALRGEADLLGNDFLFTDAHGNETWTKVTATPFLDDDGQVLGAISMIQDIDSLKRAELALKESETLFRTLGEAMPDLLWMSDSRGEPIYQNPAWTAYTGLSNDDLAKQGWQVVNHPEDLETLSNIWRRAVANGEGFGLEARARRHDGQYRWFSFRTVPVKDENGVVTRWVGTATDIHARKMAEEELHLADKRKDVFLATLAHELRNPMAPILSSIELLRTSPSESEVSAVAIETLQRQLAQMTRLVDDLMDVGRITHDKLELRTAPVSLGSILSAAVESVEPAATAAGVTVLVELEDPGIVLNADAARMTQVFGNLLHNSCKFTPAGGTVSVRSRRNGNWVEVVVKDDGHGIEPAHLDSVFEMFTQVAGPREATRAGLGIGLTLVKRLVEMHGGSVTARSEGTGKGSEFVLQLPVLAELKQEQEPIKNDESSHRPLRILVVDDNEDAAVSLARLLSFDGHEAETAHDGLHAVRQAEQFRPDVVLMDIGLPVKSGLEACRDIREKPWGQDMLIVAISGWGQPEDIERSKDSGFDEHLVKPVESKKLRELLSRA